MSYDAAVRWRLHRASVRTEAAPVHAAVWLAFMAGACMLHEPTPDDESEFVDLYLEDGIEICGGQLDAYDRFVERIYEFYTGAGPGDFRVAVHAAADPDCDEGRSCALNGTVWLRQDFAQYHEITHIMQGQVDGGSIPSLKEGTAESLGPMAPISYGVDWLADVEPDFLFASTGADVDYPRAAAFTRFVIDRWGIDSYRTFFRAMGELDTADEDDYRREFEAVFGQPLDDAWPVFLSEPRCAYDFPFCEQRNPIELPFELNGVDCSEAETLGYDATALDLPSNQVPYLPATILHLDNAAPRTVTLELEYVTIYLGGCGDCASQEPALLLGSSDNPDFPPIRFDLDLQAGTTVFFVRSQAGGTSRVSISAAD